MSEWDPVRVRRLDLDGLRELVFTPYRGRAFRGHGVPSRSLVPKAYRPGGYRVLLEMVSGYLKYNGISRGPFPDPDIEVLEMAALRVFHELSNAQGIPVPDLASTTGDPLSEAQRAISWGNGRNGAWMDARWTEVACLAQHYGVPTRLLDWSTDVNVALHFAATSALRHIDDGEECLCVWSIDLDAALRTIPGLDVIRPDYSRNPNMRAQSGIMTLVRRPAFGRLQDPLDDQLRRAVRSAEMMVGPENMRMTQDAPILERLDIPYDLLGELSAYLSSHRYDSSRFNPGFRGSYLCMEECRAYSRLPDRRE